MFLLRTPDKSVLSVAIETLPSDTFLRLGVPIIDYSSFVDITAPGSWRYKNNASTFWHQIFTVLFYCLYQYFYDRLKQSNDSKNQRFIIFLPTLQSFNIRIIPKHKTKTETKLKMKNVQVFWRKVLACFLCSTTTMVSNNPKGILPVSIRGTRAIFETKACA